MKILLSGATGLVGSALVPFLKEHGHAVSTLVREMRPYAEDCIFWDPVKNILDPHQLEGFDAIINLCGENIAKKRWNDEVKKEILESRVRTTRLLAQTLAALTNPPKLFINGSATGIYGDRSSELLTEDSLGGNDFLATVCKEWEAAAKSPQSSAGRVLLLRTGMVMTPKGGALKNLLPPFRLGLGGVIGSGEQYMSWIALDDLLGIILFVIEHEGISGPVNAVSPHPVTNYQFTKALGKTLHRPTLFPMPAFAAKLAFGEMAEALILSSARVLPQKLTAAGYAFMYPTIESALEYLLERSV